MSGYNETSVIEKLNKLNGSQESIQTLSQWIMYHRKYAKETTRIWAEQLQKVSLQKKLQFLYVANDVVQLNRRKDGEFVKEFSVVLPDSISHVYRHGDDGTRKAIVRLLDVWNDRKVYSPLFINELKTRLGIDAAAQVDPVGQKEDPVHQAIELKKDTAKMGELLSKINDLGATIIDNVPRDLTLGHQSHMIPREFLEPNFTTKIKDKDTALDELGRVSDQFGLLEQFEARIAADVEDRTSLIAAMKKLIADQEAILRATQFQQEDCHKKLAKMGELKDTLKNIADSLPAFPSSRTRSQDQGDSFGDPAPYSRGGEPGDGSYAPQRTSMASSFSAYFIQQQQQQQQAPLAGPASHLHPSSNWPPQQPYPLNQTQPSPQQPAQGLGPGPSSSSGMGPF